MSSRTKFFALNGRDFFKGLVVAVLSAFLAVIHEAILSPDFWSVGTLKKAGLAAGAAGLAYIMKNLFTNSSGQMMTLEK